MADKVSGSRFGRLARIGWLSRRAVPIAWKRLREATDAKNGERGALAEKLLEKHADIAEEAFKTLGDLKGIALKVGQMMSYLDGALPEEYRAVYQKVLARLLKDAPALPYASVRRVIEEDLGAPPEALFRAFDERPLAAASIGQVHRAELASGETVAVKVQYPGVDRAMTSDLKNVSMLRSMIAPLFGLAGKGTMARNQREVLDEIAARLLEELDYRHEAAMQERFRALFAGDPDIRIPRVIADRSAARVLTTEFATGRTFHEVCERATQAERNRFGVVIARFAFTSIYQHRLFNADPHPGNYLFADDGAVLFLDFGCVKEIPEWMNRAMTSYMRAAIGATRAERVGAADALWKEFDAIVNETFKLDPTDATMFNIYRDFVLYCLRPFLRDEEFEFTPAYTGESIDLVLDGVKRSVFRGAIPRIPNMPPVPADFTLLSRLQWGLYSLLTMLRARANWQRTLPEAVRG